jgi:hypothetical protein
MDGGQMAANFQLVIDCRDAQALASFWAAALGYVPESPPQGFDTWVAWRQDVGFPQELLNVGVDSIVDPDGVGPRIWFRTSSEPKVVKNRWHMDIHASADGAYLSSVRSVPLEVRRQRVDAEAARLVALGATITGPLTAPGLDHYAVGMLDPEGNEFDIN